MSALFGIFSRDDAAPPPIAHLDPMAAQLGALGSDGNRHRCDGGIGLGCLWWDDVAGPGRDASLFVDHASGLVTVAEGWLVDFHDLARRFRLPPRASFAHLAGGLWQQLGERGIEDLAGEFNIVIWSRRERRLWMIASPAGNPALYVWESPNRLAFASRTRALHAVPGIEAHLDWDHLARSIVPGVGFLGRHSTNFANVDRLRPGTIREYRTDGATRRRWWQVDPERRLQMKPEDIHDALADRLKTVLRSRMAGGAPVACLLSGGLDSSTVVTYAHAVSPRGPLTALAAVHTLPARGSLDERPYVQSLRDHLGLSLVEVTAEGRGPFDDPRALVRAIESPFVTSRHFVYTTLAQAARERGARVVLDGFLGELSVSRDGTDAVIEELAAGRIGWVMREVRAYARVRQRSALRAAARLLAVPVWRRRIRPRRPDLDRSVAWSWLRESFVRDRGIDAAALARAVAAATAPGRGHRRDLARDLDHLPGASPWFVGADDLTMSWPLLDRQIVELCLAAPPAMKFRDGHSRALARHLLRGAVPDAIRLRASKLPFSQDFDLRLNSQIQQVRDDLAAIADDDPVCRVVDVPKLRRLARGEMSSPRGPTSEEFGMMHCLPNGIYTIAFLREYAQAR
jgi:asparagine synthase (glutamine-hydrolysing)